MRRYNYAFRFMLIVLVIVLNLYFVNAFGVSTLYSDNYPLRMKPGEVKETFFLVRNVVEGDSNVIIKPELVKGNNIAELVDGNVEYDMRFGDEIEVPVRVFVPMNAEVGATYKVGALFKPSVEKTGAGNIQFVVNIGKSFPVVVVGRAESSKGEGYSLTVEDDEGLTESFAPITKKNLGFVLIIGAIFFFGIIILVVVIVFLVMRNKRLKEQELMMRGMYNP